MLHAPDATLLGRRRSLWPRRELLGDGAEVRPLASAGEVGGLVGGFEEGFEEGWGEEGGEEEIAIAVEGVEGHLFPCLFFGLSLVWVVGGSGRLIPKAWVGVVEEVGV